MKQEEDFDAILSGDVEQTATPKSNWFKRIKKGIITSTNDKEDATAG